jgi:CheY-like chemotaxis protein
MPRLLLVDDNPSIHKIAETLLATSSIELVCVDSAAAALEKVHRGELFDVALVDTSMAGIDGWSLVEMLRGIPSTARIPIAMMAGVLDTVDPERIREAPIQGFLKKPVELRELGDRIIRLMETPVPFPESSIPSLKLDSPFATLPATRLDDLPEFRQKQASSAPVEDDLLELTEEDLYPEPLDPVVAAVEPEPVEESLDLEELDLDSLRGLSSQPEDPPVPASVADHSDPTPQEWAWPMAALDGIATLDGLPAPLVAEEPAPQVLASFAEVDLPDLGAPTEELMDISSLSNLPEIEEVITAEQLDLPLADLLEEPIEETSFTPPLPPLEESLDWSDESESMLATMAVSAPMDAPQTLTLPEDELELLDVAMPEMAPEPNVLQLDLDEASPLLEEQAPVEISMVPESTEAIVESALLESAAAPAEEPEAVLAPAVIVSPGSRELLDALLADPVLMDTLAKAVVARLGDQVLREIAWEVIPELAERLPRS